MDIVGMQFNYLKVLEFYGRNKHKKKLYKCYCTRCGNEKIMIGTEVKNGYSKSCGCLNKVSHSKKHGMTGTLIYNKWKGMKQRCYNSNYDFYRAYGGRGIKVCDEWKDDFMQFYKDMGNVRF